MKPQIFIEKMEEKHKEQGEKFTVAGNSDCDVIAKMEGSLKKKMGKMGKILSKTYSMNFKAKRKKWRRN